MARLRPFLPAACAALACATLTASASADQLQGLISGTIQKTRNWVVKPGTAPNLTPATVVPLSSGSNGAGSVTIRCETLTIEPGASLTAGGSSAAGNVGL